MIQTAHEKVAVFGIKREEEFLYFLRGSDVYRTPLMKPSGIENLKLRPEGLSMTYDQVAMAHKIADGNFIRDPHFIYFLDQDGDVSRAPRTVPNPPQCYVAGFLFDPELELVVLIRKLRPKWMAGRYNGIGGHVEDQDVEKARETGTSAGLEAMIREWREETGDESEIDWKPFMRLETRGGVIHFFAATGDVSQPTTVTDELVGYFSAAALPHNVLPNLRWLVPMAQNHLRESDSCSYFQIREDSYRSEMDR